MTQETLSPTQLAKRWSIAPRTLAYWRQTGKGPRWFRIGGAPRGRIAYPIAVIIEWEAK